MSKREDLQSTTGTRPRTLKVEQKQCTHNIDHQVKNDIKKTLDLKILKEKNLINKNFLKLKILGSGEIKKTIEISAHFASKKALSKIEKAGGKINIIKK